MTPGVSVSIGAAREVAPIVAVCAARLDGVQVRENEPALDGVLRDAVEAVRSRTASAQVTSAVRTMYKSVGLDPTKTRPSSEALLRRVRKGEPFPRVNSLVDVINWCSLESQLPFGLYDAKRVRGAILLRLGHPGEVYPGIRKDAVHLDGRLVLVDEEGPFGNPTSDSARTMVTTATTSGIVVIFAPVAVDATLVQRTLDMTLARVARFCAAR